MNTYLVYNKTSLKVVSTFESFGKEINKLLKSDTELSWLNTTHPASANLLTSINAANNTDYKSNKAVQKGDNITIIGRRWFDRINGNTYFSAVGLVNNIEVVNIPFEYGYGNHYEDRIFQELQKAGYCPDAKEMEAFWRYCEQRGITKYVTHSDVNRKKDL